MQVEQAHRNDRRWRHNRDMHTQGVSKDPLIAEVAPSQNSPGTGSLLVTGNSKDAFVTVQPGMAIDSLGEEMMLLSPATVNIPKQGLQLPGTFNVYAEYSEQPSDPSSDPGITGNTRISETPTFQVALAPPNPNKDVLLASVSLDGNGALTAAPTDLRAFAGTILPPDLLVSSLTFRYGQNQANWPKFNAGQANEADLTGNLSVTGYVKAASFQGDGSGLTKISDNTKVAKAGDTMTGPLKLNPGQGLRIEGGTGPNDNANYFSFGGNGAFGIDAPNVPNGRFTVQNSGNVGIGVASPQKPLDVGASGGIRVNRTENASNANEILFQDNGQIRSLDNNHRIIFDRASNILELREYGPLVFSPGATSGARTQTVTFNADGSITLTGLIMLDPEKWNAATLQNGWTYFGAPYNQAGYFLDKFGVVHLTGLVSNPNANPPSGSTIFTLPAGYRPGARELHAVQVNPNAIGRCDILTTGEVQMIAPTQGAGGWFSLDGITFRVAQGASISVLGGGSNVAVLAGGSGLANVIAAGGGNPPGA